MRFNQPLIVENAGIQTVAVKHKDGLMISRIKITGRCTPEIASLLFCKEVVYQEAEVPRRSFEQVKLEGGCETFTAHLQAKGLRQAVKLHGESVSDLLIEKRDDLSLNFSFCLNCAGDPLPFLNYWVLVGSALGTCTVTPLQAELLSMNPPPASVEPSEGKRVQ